MMPKEVVDLLHFKQTTTKEHMLLNLFNFNFFRKSDGGEAIMFLGNNRFLIWLIAVPYVVSSELVFLRTTRFWVMLKDQVAGVLIVLEEPDSLYINNLAVAPEYREHGIGTAMLKNCIRIAKRLGKSRLELSVVKTNIPAIRLYEKIGFKVKKSRRWSLILTKKVNDH
jgi:ribosomal protein S18 acetylase RimI-like enzyme